MLIQNVIFNINDFINNSELFKILDKLDKKDEKLVVINNSFLFREKIKTNKNKKYLAFTPDKIPVNEDNCFIIEGIELKNNYKIVNRNLDKLNYKKSLNDAIDEEVKNLGDILFVLMGEIDNNIEIKIPLENSIINTISYSPKYTDKISFRNFCLYINNIESEDELWDSIERILLNEGNSDTEIENLKNIIGNTFDELKKAIYLNMKIPVSFNQDKDYFLELIYKSIKEQVDIYGSYIENLESAKVDRDSSFNEVLRIAYNFADDAITLIRLIISVCDLKPIILWNTFSTHYRLTESIKNLPWSKRVKKPSISKYVDTIKKARNKSFHRLIPFSEAFEIELPENSIKDVNLRIFSEYGSKNSANRLTYKDKELVDVLMEFTRTSEEIVKESYWKKNLDTMKLTVELLRETANTLRELKSYKDNSHE